MGYRVDLVEDPRILVSVVLTSVMLSAVNILSGGRLFGYEDSLMSFISMFTWSLFISLIFIYGGIVCLSVYRNSNI